MKQKNILVLCDQSDVYVIKNSFKDNHNYNITIDTTENILSTGAKKYLQDTIRLIKENPYMFDGITGTHDSSAVFASIICQETGKIFTPVEGVISCQNKYISRMIQKECVPENTPDFYLEEEYLQGTCDIFPVFVKPVHSNVSFSSHHVNSLKELQALIHKNSQLLSSYNQYFIDSLAVSSEPSNSLNLKTCNRFICEGIVSGDQVTVDGFIFDNNITIYGITMAVFFEGSISFSHHEFPYELSPKMENKLHHLLNKLIPALALNNTFFNVELRIDKEEGQIYIIEVNSRIAFQFSKTIEAVRGFNSLHCLCDIAAGKNPALKVNSKKTNFKYCYNFELRTFNDKKIIKTPVQADIDRINTFYPEIEIRNLIDNDTQLSDYKQNPESFRYCIIDIPGNSQKEIMDKFEQVKSMLDYQFADTEVIC
ncbi:MAG: ATP-grasp domain-containing protein [Clostridiales bacterium]|nr:ATP-grasp domain-containing protein [Clostridiales bacterium]MCF8023095.1 ATP-grasp domain-containing protein [Clostridiales bacterium]